MIFFVQNLLQSGPWAALFAGFDVHYMALEKMVTGNMGLFYLLILFSGICPFTSYVNHLDAFFYDRLNTY
jgi:hypothetical protein